MSDEKPVRTLELQVDIDAPIEEAWKERQAKHAGNGAPKKTGAPAVSAH